MVAMKEGEVKIKKVGGETQIHIGFDLSITLEIHGLDTLKKVKYLLNKMEESDNKEEALNLINKRISILEEFSDRNSQTL